MRHRRGVWADRLRIGGRLAWYAVNAPAVPPRRTRPTALIVLLVFGDACGYWIARTAKGRLRDWMDRAGGSDTGARALRLLRERGPVFLLFVR